MQPVACWHWHANYLSARYTRQGWLDLNTDRPRQRLAEAWWGAGKCSPLTLLSHRKGWVFSSLPVQPGDKNIWSANWPGTMHGWERLTGSIHLPVSGTQSRATCFVQQVEGKQGHMVMRSWGRPGIPHGHGGPLVQDPDGVCLRGLGIHYVRRTWSVCWTVRDSHTHRAWLMLIS